MPLLALAALAGLAYWAIKAPRREPGPPAGYSWPPRQVLEVSDSSNLPQMSRRPYVDLQLMLLRLGYFGGTPYAIIPATSEETLLANPVFAAAIGRFRNDYASTDDFYDVSQVYNQVFFGGPGISPAGQARTAQNARAQRLFGRN